MLRTRCAAFKGYPEAVVGQARQRHAAFLVSQFLQAFAHPYKVVDVGKGVAFVVAVAGAAIACKYIGVERFLADPALGHEVVVEGGAGKAVVRRFGVAIHAVHQLDGAREALRSLLIGAGDNHVQLLELRLLTRTRPTLQLRAGEFGGVQIRVDLLGIRRADVQVRIQIEWQEAGIHVTVVGVRAICQERWPATVACRTNTRHPLLTTAIEVEAGIACGVALVVGYKCKELHELLAARVLIGRAVLHHHGSEVIELFQRCFQGWIVRDITEHAASGGVATHEHVTPETQVEVVHIGDVAVFAFRDGYTIAGEACVLEPGLQRQPTIEGVDRAVVSLGRRLGVRGGLAGLRGLSRRQFFDADAIRRATRLQGQARSVTAQHIEHSAVLTVHALPCLVEAVAAVDSQRQIDEELRIVCEFRLEAGIAVVGLKPLVD